VGPTGSELRGRRLAARPIRLANPEPRRGSARRLRGQVPTSALPAPVAPGRDLPTAASTTGLDTLERAFCHRPTCVRDLQARAHGRRSFTEGRSADSHSARHLVTAYIGVAMVVLMDLMTRLYGAPNPVVHELPDTPGAGPSRCGMHSQIPWRPGIAAGASRFAGFRAGSPFSRVRSTVSRRPPRRVSVTDRDHDGPIPPALRVRSARHPAQEPGVRPVPLTSPGRLSGRSAPAPPSARRSRRDARARSRVNRREHPHSRGG
jgi:hypothetical protein